MGAFLAERGGEGVVGFADVAEVCWHRFGLKLVVSGEECGWVVMGCLGTGHRMSVRNLGIWEPVHGIGGQIVERGGNIGGMEKYVSQVFREE